MNQTLLQLRDERTSIDMTELVRSGLGLVGFRFLGATQATQTFNTYDYTMEAFEFKWVNVSGLPLAMWNKDFISNILAAQGKLIGYDLNNVGHNYISGVHHTPESESEDEDDIMSLHNSGKVGNDELLVCRRP
ncbi:hypothetical protein POTOM_049303 [Populus tomentosa]|uniref:DUF4283 domain-containing protein n=1 Tax=Populus tomentosa TaxID=118781 RepID=A0A8X7YDP2_POPTO|nr:hypothetical protein POTOM_049303 [Populus tomentosa]